MKIHKIGGQKRAMEMMAIRTSAEIRIKRSRTFMESLFKLTTKVGNSIVVF
jgi:hypothetical protein